ncbi:MAG: M10 family metallopeptidase C-terminal domain-containing protein [Alphaproteobacteria bacterium]
MAAKPVYTNAQVINQLNSGYLWSGTSWTYGFPTTASWFPYGEKVGFSVLSAAQQSVATTAIKLWDDLIVPDVAFNSNGVAATIKYANTTTNIGYAQSYYPTTATGGGTVWFNPTYNSGTNNLVTPTAGIWAFRTYIHETGHALGLEHPGAYNGGSPTYENDAVYMQDSNMYTVMSYFSASKTGADWVASDGVAYYPQTPMLHDVLAIQAMYGAETTTRTGDTTYGFNANVDLWLFDFRQNPHPIVTIYDSAGTDTLDLSGWNWASVIDLTPGAFSSGDQMTYNISIAYSAWIENGVGGGGGDRITGNEKANRLTGNGGADTIDGGLGDDTLVGGAGNDSLIGGAGSDTAVFSGARSSYAVAWNAANATFLVSDLRSGASDGADTVGGVEFFGFSDQTLSASALQSAGAAPMVGTASGDRLTGSAGSDFIQGLGGNDSIVGLAGADTLDGGAGVDTMVGGQGDDIYYVDDTRDAVRENANEGTDKVFSAVTFTAPSNVENVSLTGTAAINATGNSAANMLVGNASANTLDGGSGADTLQGGGGNDIYIVDNAGERVIEAAGEGVDLVQASVTFTLPDFVENLTLTGSSSLAGVGNGAGNVIVGNSGANQLSGGDGADTLVGGNGRDQLSGGPGADVFDFNATGESARGSNRDVILDFDDLDRIDLSTIDASTRSSGDQAFTFIGSAAFSGVAGQLRFDTKIVSGALVVQADTNGDRTVDLEIEVRGQSSLYRDDFVL